MTVAVGSKNPVKVKAGKLGMESVLSRQVCDPNANRNPDSHVTGNADPRLAVTVTVNHGQG